MVRQTAQRAAVRKVLQQADRPLGPAEIHRSASQLVPRIGLTTIYRAVKALVEEGWIVEVKLPGEPSRYELGGKPHHHHFRCRACHGVFEVHGCADNFEQLTPRDFLLERHQLVLYGLCADCDSRSQEAQAERSRPSAHPRHRRAASVSRRGEGDVSAAIS